MKKVNLNKNWKFVFGSDEEHWMGSGNFENARTVDLPHDYRIELERTPASKGGLPEAYYPSGIGYYEYELDGDGISEKQVILSFDGVYRYAEVRLNGNLIKLHESGYIPFSRDLTGKIKNGKNYIRVRVNGGTIPCSRWYPGAGIYRDVNLLISDKTAYIKPNGIKVTTQKACADSSEVTVNVSMYMERRDYIVRYIVSEKSSGEPVCVCTDEEIFAAATEGYYALKKNLLISPCKLWTDETPNLYTVTAQILSQSGDLIDEYAVTTGIRTVELDKNEGIKINGNVVKLKGGCVHHDNGILGSRSYASSEYRKVQKLKESGFNAIRCAHNPPSDVFLEACDTLGMYVIDEFFDVWREGKRSNDEHLYFEHVWESDIESTIDRDYNRPSIIMWSTGNEIIERDGISDGYAWAKKLADKVRSLDSTRLVTNALCDLWGTNPDYDTEKYPDKWSGGTAEFAAPLDIVGYNYLLWRYDGDLKLFPERFIAGTESFPLQALDNWQAVMKYPHVVGDFVWTSMDYLGESGIGNSRFDIDNAQNSMEYPWHVAFCGDIDITGHKRPQSHYRDFVWSGRTKPYICVTHPVNYGKDEKVSAWGWQNLEESWTYPEYEGKPINVTVYSAGDSVKLYIGGKLIDEKPSGEANRYTAVFDTVYESGKIEAVTMMNGSEIDRATLETSGKPAGLKITSDTSLTDISGGEVTFHDIEVIDENGNKVPYADNKIIVTGNVLAIGSSNPAGDENHSSNVCNAYQGRITVASIGDIQVEFGE